MSEAAELIRQGMEREGTAGNYFGLFCLGLFVLWMLSRLQEAGVETGIRDAAAAADEAHGEAAGMAGYGLSALLAVCCPPLVWLLCMKTSAVTPEELFLLLPALPVTALACTLLCRTQRTARRRRWCVLSCILLIVLGGTVLPYRSPALKTKYADRNVTAVIEAVSAQKEALGETVVLLGQQEIMECARRYDGELELLYGKDMWMPEANTAVADRYPQDYVYLYERMKTDYQDPEEMARMAGRFGCNVLVLREKLDAGSAEAENWVLAAEIPGYVVYRKTEA